MYTDTHCHLEMIDGAFPTSIVERARAAGVSTLMTVGVDLASSAECVQTASSADDVWAVVGIHPHNAIEATPAVLDRLRDLARHPRVVGIGETGLDYYRDHSPHAQQHAAFRAQIHLARELDRTLVVHCRDAEADLLALLDEQEPPDRVVLHCFSGDDAFAAHCAARGWFMSFSGTVTFTNAPDLRKTAANVPPELLLTETDAPYLSPHPHRGQANEPARVPLVAATLAELHGTDAERMGRLTSDNARRAFALPAADASG